MATHKMMGCNKEICKPEMVNILVMGCTQAFGRKMLRQLTMECKLISCIQVMGSSKVTYKKVMENNRETYKQGMVNMLGMKCTHSFCHKLTMECRL